MRIIDLTHVIAEGMSVYPGTEPPRLAPVDSFTARRRLRTATSAAISM